VKTWKKIKYIPEKFPETAQSTLLVPLYSLVKGCFKQWKIAIDNGWPVLYSGFGSGA
jgi:hypothetical protein